MAFVNRIGNMLKQSVSRHINVELCASNSSLYQAIRCMSSSKVFVGGLSYGTDEMSLREAFSQYGEVVEARIIMDRETGRSRGFAFVSYTSNEEASSAIQGMDGQDLQGRRIRVNYATERPRGGGFGGGYGGGSYGGGGYGGGGYGGSSYGGSGGFRSGSYAGGSSNDYTAEDGSYSRGAGYGGGKYGSGGSGSYDGGNSGGYGPYGGGSNSVNYNVAEIGDNNLSGGSGSDSVFASTGFSGATGTSYGVDEERSGGNQGQTEGGKDGFGQDMLEGNYGDRDDEPDDYANTRG